MHSQGVYFMATLRSVANILDPYPAVVDTQVDVKRMVRMRDTN